MSKSKNFPLRHFGPACLAGITFSDWVRVLAHNRFIVSPRYWGKVPGLTINGLITSVIRPVEAAVYKRRIAKVEVKDPVFIVGCWRSGTTHLHNMLCQDEQFNYSNLYQTMFPHSFLLTESWWRPVLDLFTPKKRFMDNMEQGLRETHEDEMALCIMTLYSNMLSWAFPRNSAHYERYLDFAGVPEVECQIWREALDYFVRKLTVRNAKQLILKSPNHTARIQMILQQYPNAKFIHLHRNPYDVYRSFVHMAEQVSQVWGLQYLPKAEIPEMVIRTYDQLYSAYLDQVAAIPEGQLVEVAYADVVESPLPTIERIYQEIGLENLDTARPKLEAYAAAKSNYKRNQHSNVPAETLTRLNQAWSRYFDAFGYDKRLPQ